MQQKLLLNYIKLQQMEACSYPIHLLLSYTLSKFCAK